MTGVQEDSMTARNLSILRSGKYSDITICCKKISIPIHRAIVCPASRFFASAYDGDVKEAHTGIISLKDEADIVKMMLLYLYTQGYDDHVASFENYRMGDPGARVAFNERTTPDAAVEETCILRMTNNVKVYAIADRHVIPGLKELARTKFRNLASSIELLLDFPSIISKIYDTTPAEDRGLRDIVMNVCAPHVVCASHDIDGNEWSTVQTHVGFKFDLLRAFTKIFQKTQMNLQVAEEDLLVAETNLLAVKEKVGNAAKP